MASVTLDISVDSSAVSAVLDRLQPVTDRLAAHMRDADPHGALVGLELAFGDLVDQLVENNLLTMVTAEPGPKMVVEPSPVLNSLADLMGAICDWIDAQKAVAS